MTPKKHIAIVGGGILGMTLSLGLAEMGFRVTLIEGEDRTGGLASPAKIGEHVWDRYYHVVLMSDSHLLSLLDRLSLMEEVYWGQAKTGFYTDGRFHSMSNIFEFLAFPPLTVLDKLRLAFTIFYASKIRSWQRLEKVTVSSWLTRLSGKRTFEKIWLPLLKSKLGHNYQITSASFIWSIIARMYAARRSGLKTEMFGYVNGGYATILDSFQKLLDEVGVETLCGVSAESVSSLEGSALVETVEGRTLKFDDVILTIPCGGIAALCPQMTPAEKGRFQKVTYQGITCASLILKKPLGEYYVTNITESWVPFTAVIEMTALVDLGSLDGHSLVYLPRYLTQEDPFWQVKEDQIREMFINALGTMYPDFRKDDVLHFNVSRSNQVLPITTLNYSAGLLPSIRTSLEHVFVVNSAQIPNGTMNVNEIIGLANTKAMEIGAILTS